MTLTIRHGDCRNVLATLPAQSVHCCVTSPPYFGLRDYGVAGQIGLEPTPDAYVAELVAVFREVRRVLRDDGTLWLNLGDSYAGGGGHSPNAPSSATSKSGLYGMALKEGGIKPQGSIKPKDLIGIPWRVAFALQADGWYLRQDIIWSKPNPMPESVTDRCTKAHEYIFLMSKSARYYFDNDAIREPHQDKNGIERFVNGCGVGERQSNQGWAGGKVILDQHREYNPLGRNRRSVWQVASQPFSEAHFATFPPDLIEPCIKAGCPEKTCAKCGAPWIREVERTRTFESGSGRSGNMPVGKNGSNMQGGGATPDIRCGPIVHTKTLGFAPTCSCNSGTVGGTVLDPFGGAGTTGLVADRLGRDALLIELNPAYAGMAENRLRDDAGMFADIA